eukprot:TRINITY_DN9133_c0_g1_i1.p1 TRINITY_DN9133_c0_g1~~TRINITY_DN9133_c0_g1_i1.p1  ORF type:complete len:404 (-),score=84.64 TRINITY_DN9133_c0_g1_i1:52-1263(-)
MFHSKKARDLLENFLIGVLKESPKSKNTQSALYEDSEYSDEDSTEGSEDSEEDSGSVKTFGYTSTKPAPKYWLGSNFGYTSGSSANTPKHSNSDFGYGTSSGSLLLEKKEAEATFGYSGFKPLGFYDEDEEPPKRAETPIKVEKTKGDKHKTDKKHKKHRKSATEGEKGAISTETLTSFKLDAISWVNHDTQLYKFKVPKKQALNTPVGSHITIQHDHLKRSYTPITDKPGSFELCVKTYKTNNMSEWLSSLQEGDKVKMRGPYGKWLYQSNTYTRLCMYAAGSGLTPFYRILATICQDSSDDTKLHLLFSNKEARDIIFKKKLDKWERENDNFKIHYTITREEDKDQYLKGRISKEMVEATIEPNTSDPKEFHLICGSDGFVATIKDILLELGVATENVHAF